MTAKRKKGQFSGVKNFMSDKRHLGIFMALFGVIGVIMLVSSWAVGPFAALEVETSNLASGAVTGSDAGASNSQYVQFGGGGGGGNPDYDTIGVVGCSNTGEHAVGYKLVSSQDRMWPITRAQIGGGSMKTWYNGIGDSPNQYWDIFNSYNSSDPPDAVWVQMCIRTNEDTSASGMTVAQQNQLTAIINEVTSIAGNVDIVISPLNSYNPPGICSQVGTVGVENAVELADWAVSTGLADVRGPDPGPLSSSQLDEDLCHLNSSGESFVGAQLVDFFDD